MARRFMEEVDQQAPFRIVKVKTDNGSEFTSAYLPSHGPGYKTAFELYLARRKLKYVRIQPGKPWQNGRVECQHRLDRERFYNRMAFASLEEAREFLKAHNEESMYYYRPSRKGISVMEQLEAFRKGEPNEETLCGVHAEQKIQGNRH